MSILKAILVNISAAVLWGFVVIPIRELHFYNAIHILIVRIFLAFLCLWLYILAFKRQQLTIDFTLFRQLSLSHKKKVIVFIAISSLCLAVNWFAYIFMITHISISLASLVYIICPILTAIAAFIILKDAIDRFKIIALVLGSIALSIKAQGVGLEIFWVLFCAIGYTFFIICQKFLPPFSKVTLFAFQLFGVILIIFPFLVNDIKTIIQDLLTPLHSTFWLYTFIIAILFTIVPMLLNLTSLAYLPTSTAAIIIYTNPIVSFLIGIIIYNEQINHWDVYVYSLLGIAVLIFNYPLLKKNIKLPF